MNEQLSRKHRRTIPFCELAVDCSMNFMIIGVCVVIGAGLLGIACVVGSSAVAFARWIL